MEYSSEFDLPGFRFHPTEEELLDFYLRRAVAGKKLNVDIIATVNLYHYEPWDLPSLSKIGEKEWYYFVPRDRRQGSGGRPNRTTERGFWKATGSDRPIRSAVDPRRLIGLKKTLVYYRGRAPRGIKTDWVMNEYRLPELSGSAVTPPSLPMEEMVLCKIYKKATTQRELEERAAMEEDSRGTTSTSSGQENVLRKLGQDGVIKEEEQMEATEVEPSSSGLFEPVFLGESPAVEVTPAVRSMPETVEASRQPKKLPAIQVPSRGEFEWMQDPFIRLPAIQVPSRGEFEWMQDPFIHQLRSPWLEQWSPLYAQLLNF